MEIIVGLKETNAINRSLLALGNVVNALAFRKQHVPIRDSGSAQEETGKLTLMLSDSLGGDYKVQRAIRVGSASVQPPCIKFVKLASFVADKEVHACVNVLPCAAAEPWVEGYVQGVHRILKKAQEALVDAERRRSDAELRFAMLHCPTETGFDQQTNRILAQNYKLLLLHVRLMPKQQWRLSGDALETRTDLRLPQKGEWSVDVGECRLSDAVACLEEQLAGQHPPSQEDVEAILEAVAYVRGAFRSSARTGGAGGMLVKAQEQRAMSEAAISKTGSDRVCLGMSQALATDGMSFASIVRSASAKEVAAQKLLADAERRSQELARREGPEAAHSVTDTLLLPPIFLRSASNRSAYTWLRQEVERQKSELRARRLSLLASREASAAEALRQKQQIQDQAKTIEDLQHQLERQKEKASYPGDYMSMSQHVLAVTMSERLWRATSEPQIRYSTRKAGDLKTREAPWYKGTVKKVINNLPKYNAMSTEEKPKKNKAANKPQSMEISEPKAPKLTKSQKREKRKQALSLGKVGKTSPTAMPAASPTLKAVSPKATPEEDTQMKVDVEKSKKRRRKEQRRAIQVHKTQLKKKGQTAHLKS
ncbi:Kinesin-related protein 2 [Symbiodinium microadriaticum]|uniref:Kinesin-related protein 2 n=2 Tax=Symbiodinium TaxID=2949 RepID=A0A1Q9EDC2_SYMMI|nr:Kinesin-related protein 2 [Symbiodinium microadriaticum]